MARRENSRRGAGLFVAACAVILGLGFVVEMGRRRLERESKVFEQRLREDQAADIGARTGGVEATADKVRELEETVARLEIEVERTKEAQRKAQSTLVLREITDQLRELSRQKEGERDNSPVIMNRESEEYRITYPPGDYNLQWPPGSNPRDRELR